MLQAGQAAPGRDLRGPGGRAQAQGPGRHAPAAKVLLRLKKRGRGQRRRALHPAPSHHQTREYNHDFEVLILDLKLVFTKVTLSPN